MHTRAHTHTHTYTHTYTHTVIPQCQCLLLVTAWEWVSWGSPECGLELPDSHHEMPSSKTTDEIVACVNVMNNLNTCSSS